ncbi:MAG: addiction module protein [Candidatus Scalinduaceae bacterium]
MKQLSHNDRLRAMEAIWKDLSSDEESFESPSWHKDVLKNTENRMNDGIEEVVVWDTAKKNLRKNFE